MAISGRQLRFRRWLSHDSVGSCEIATAPLGPRNDNLGVLAILATAGTSRSCSAGRGLPRPYNGGYGRRSSRKFATAIGAQYPQGARRIRKAAKPPTAAQ